MCWGDLENFRTIQIWDISCKHCLWSIFGPCWCTKSCKTIFYAHLSRIWKLARFTRVIRKVFAAKILLSGKLVSMAWFSVTTGLKFFVLINAFNFDEKHPQMKKKLHWSLKWGFRGTRDKAFSKRWCRTDKGLICNTELVIIHSLILLAAPKSPPGVIEPLSQTDTNTESDSCPLVLLLFSAYSSNKCSPGNNGSLLKCTYKGLSWGKFKSFRIRDVKFWGLNYVID